MLKTCPECDGSGFDENIILEDDNDDREPCTECGGDGVVPGDDDDE